MKYLLLSLLLTGCSVGAHPSDDLNKYFIPREDLNYLVDQEVTKHLAFKHDLLKNWSESCKEIAKCIGKPTYVGLDPSSGYNDLACMLVKNDKRVECSIQ
jgi:hypothetical protein